MKDKHDKLLYIGKSKNINSRVRSYFRNNKELTPRISLMVRQVYDIEFIVTDSETEALTLESNLIKTHQPYFNVLLKDDKKYPYLCITWSEDYPRVFITRKRRQRHPKDRYYGPYVDVTFLRQTLFTIKKVFLVRQRPRPLYKDRPCLNYSIKRCPGVCQQLITSSEYQATIQKVAMIFQGRTEELKNILIDQMEKYSNSLEFELAASTRDQINGLTKLTQSQKMIVPDSSVSRDVIGISSDKNISCIQIFQMRGGKLVGRIGYVYDSVNLTNDIIIQKVIEEHFSQLDSVEIPSEILLQQPIPQNYYIQQWLSDLKGTQVKLSTPKRQQKANFVELVKRNAELEHKRIKLGKEKNSLELEDLAQVLDLGFAPRRIEGYDISHISGTDTVGSQVVFIEGIPAKQHYRKYSIKSSSITSGHSDDYMALAELMRRRFRRWSIYKSEGMDFSTLRNKKSSTLDPLLVSDWPDLIMIDGGKGQLRAALEALRELGLDSEVNICSLAKKKEEVFVPELITPLETDKDQKALHLLRRLRDEAHRYALNFHRQKRSKNMRRSRLSDIPGVGPKRITLLLDHFKSVHAIELASLQEISSIHGLGHDIAKTVWNHFHSEE